MKLLVVEDESKVARLLAEGLMEEDFTVEISADGEDALYRASSVPYDLIILDVLLPGRDGFAILGELRARGCFTPVLMLTAKDSTRDRIRGLNSGADDYLIKPFDFEELLARVRAILRRGRDLRPELLSISDLTLDVRHHRVERSGTAIELGPKEFAVLEHLLRHPGEVISRTELARQVWDENFESFSNVIDVTLYHLRSKVDRPPAVKLIHTIRGVGYVLKEL